MFDKTTFLSSHALVLAFAAVPLITCQAQDANEESSFVQYGEMHEAIGQRQHQSRVALKKITDMPHFYGIGALEGLKGEITILNSTAIVTGVTQDGLPEPKKMSDVGATMLAGKSVETWAETTLEREVEDHEFDKTIGAMAAKHDIDPAKPFVFVVEGEFTDVRLHVINGACPIRARMKKEEIDKNKLPFELETRTLKGTLIGVYAADSVGKLTHPATSTHVHLVYTDDKTGNRVTGHIEQVGLAKGAVLKLPADGDEREPE